MRCCRVKKLIGAYLDEELSARKAKQIQQHLGECAACAWELRSFQKVDDLGRWVAEARSSQLPKGYWESYQSKLYEKLEQGELYRDTARMRFPNRYWRFPLFLGAHWLQRIAPGLALVGILIAVLMFGLYIGHYQENAGRSMANVESDESEQVGEAVDKSEMKAEQPYAMQAGLNREKLTINFYLKEHQAAITQAAHTTQEPQREVELGYEDLFYYDAVRAQDRGWPGEPGIFLRAPRHSGSTVHRELPPVSDIVTGGTLNLQQAQQTVRFRVIAPQTLHPGYFLESIRKIEGKECLQLIYTNGINPLSLFEQAVDSQERLRAGDFREYVMYSRKEGDSVNIIGWNSAEIAFALLGSEDFAHLMGVIRVIQEGYLGSE